MSYDSYIPEEQAARMAGVSTRTLNRFAEAGYLRVEVESSGSRRYAQNELKDLFGIMDQPFYEKLADDIAETISDSRTEQITQAEVIDEPADGSTLSSSIETEEYGESDRPVHETRQSRDGEATRLQHILRLQEKILDLKDAEIKTLREERDWLRSRIEKLEQKGERDQLLLLSESQMVRRLITINDQKRSPVRAALEWFGLVQTQTPPAQITGTIEG